jgi:hypothetical protein
VPAPLRAANRVVLPGAPTQAGIGAVGREITPPSSPAMPAYRTPPTLAGVDPAAFNAPPPLNEPYYGAPPMPDPDERISGFSAGYRPFVLIAISLAIVIVGAIAVQTCGDDTGTAPSALPPDAEVERGDSGATSVDARPARRDAGVRGAGVRDAGATGNQTPPKRPPPKRPKGK